MNSYYKQSGGSAAMGLDLAKQLDGERDRLNNMTENELYEELLFKYQDYYEKKGYTDIIAKRKATERLTKMENRGKDKYIKEISEFNTWYNTIGRLISGARKKKKPKGSKKKGHSKKGSKGSKKKAKKATKQGGGKSRKPKKAKQTRKRPKKSRSRRPKKMKRSTRAGAGGNPFPLMVGRSDAYDTYRK